jgi:hypothetical protein
MSGNFFNFCKIIFTGNTQITSSKRKKNFKKPSGLTDEDIRGALLRNKVDITQEFGNAPSPAPGSTKLGSVSEFTMCSNRLMPISSK